MNNDCLNDINELILGAENNKIDAEVFTDYLEVYDIIEVRVVCQFIKRQTKVTLTHRLDQQFITITKQQSIKEQNV